MTLQPSESVHVMLCAWEWGKYLGNSALKIMTSSFQRPNPKSCFIEAKEQDIISILYWQLRKLNKKVMTNHYYWI